MSAPGRSRWRVPPDGDEPDYRFTLANERTYLAWIRTALGLLAGGVAVRELLSDVTPGVRSTMAIAAIVAGATLSVLAYLRWVQVQVAIRRDEPLPRSNLVAITAVGILLLAVLAVAAVVAQ